MSTPSTPSPSHPDLSTKSVVVSGGGAPASADSAAPSTPSTISDGAVTPGAPSTPVPAPTSPTSAPSASPGPGPGPGPTASASASASAPTAYIPPTKRILTPAQLQAFQRGEAHATIVGWVQRLNRAVKGVKLGEASSGSEVITALLKILDRVLQFAKETPVVENSGSRFGNPAFRVFYDLVGEATYGMHLEYLVPLGLPVEAIEEVGTYFRECWGSRTRIDYGSGMEVNFVCWLICLEKLGLFSGTEELDKALVLQVFWGYVQVMRVLQARYWLEPAGSHGVWGLDDYHFLPFLWGSGQLVGHKYIRPRAIHDREVVEEYAKDYMYFACIEFINSIKTASLRWHSPMLDDISAVKTWDKVNEGMMKMYTAEVLGKLPVMQHFLFGSLLRFEDSEEGQGEKDSEDKEECGHGHGHSHTGNIHPRVLASLKARGELVESGAGSGDLGGAGQREVGWGDCCGIPVPSVFGASTSSGTYSLSGVRPVPFD
ncbi:Phosphotyrosyl phosphatase activator [Coprinopsis marcescibilis]|uniref:Serine/threonine-protein phosphatase 2A activator n=1 Tax=Coprinopsis marcescibilis TaxID=230819 RepID=A0A5C3L5A3_COPMA|nr:Phosphotyrosyl phosphatase activator [Coprinopsis marcescibilis]